MYVPPHYSSTGVICSPAMSAELPRTTISNRRPNSSSTTRRFDNFTIFVATGAFMFFLSSLLIFITLRSKGSLFEVLAFIFLLVTLLLASITYRMCTAKPTKSMVRTTRSTETDQNDSTVEGQSNAGFHITVAASSSCPSGIDPVANFSEYGVVVEPPPSYYESCVAGRPSLPSYHEAVLLELGCENQRTCTTSAD